MAMEGIFGWFLQICQKIWMKANLARKIWERKGVTTLLALFSLALALFALSFASSWCVFDEMRRMGIYRQGNAQKSSS